MTLDDYQLQAIRTRQTPAAGLPDPAIPLLGLAGEVGELLSEYKKRLRDGDAHLLARERIAEEMGDILWYLADAADRFGLKLDEIAERNVAKCRDRWEGGLAGQPTSFDEGFPESERFPRRLELRIETDGIGGDARLRMYLEGTQLGDELSDNAYEGDGYRFHDLFHLACAAVLGWSPVLRKLLGRKRRSVPKVDQVEDGGRATAIEEGISALVFSYTAGRRRLEGVAALDYELLRTIKGMTCDLEVSACTPRDWERAIVRCYEVWRGLEARGSGTVALDLDARDLTLLD